MKTKIGIHWFRRDLRIVGNESLRFNWKVNEGRVIGLFCLDSSFLSRPDFSSNRFAFFLETLREVRREMQCQGGDLIVIDDRPISAFKRIFDYFSKSNFELTQVSYGRDYEPFAVKRDAEVSEFLSAAGIHVHNERDHLILEPFESAKDGGGFYQVYTPYYRRWFAQLRTPEIQKRIKSQAKAADYYDRLVNGGLEKIFKIDRSAFRYFPYADSFEAFVERNKKNVNIEIPTAGFQAAFGKLRQFKEHLGEYAARRDFPSDDGTSKLSIFLKNGSLVSSQIVGELGLSSSSSDNQYLKEIAWREFYYAILFNRPDCENAAFLPQYRDLKWENNDEHFLRWCEGRTGFPIVDAGMRQLNATGWMHNRVRMIVASFLVKDLLVDWRRGERYFMKMLLDGDLAPNNGGWQWAASTGCDPQPYFRIFNPWLQSEKFDCDGLYIKKFVPELAAVPAKNLHQPELNRGSNYPKPIVEHSVQKQKALLMFKNAGRG